MNTKINEFTHKEYEKRINNVLEYIEKNLDEDIDLKKLSDIANFSQFHFHRIFKAIIGETPLDFIRRIRLERSANKLKYNPYISITEIAYSCGFSSSSLFSRLFKCHFSVSPCEWRNKMKNSKNSQFNSKNKKDIFLQKNYNYENFIKRRSLMDTKKIRVEVKNVNSFKVAYVKHLKGYEDAAGIKNAFEKLFMWAGPRGFMGKDIKVIGMSLDNPDVTPKNKCRYYACVEVSGEAKPDGEVGIMEIHEGTYAVAHFKGKNEIFKKAYDLMFGAWLPQSGYEPDNFPCFEVYSNNPEEQKNKTFEFDLYIPVKPL